MPSYTRRQRLLTDEEIVASYQRTGCSEVTGAEAGVCAATVLTIVRRLGYPVRPRGVGGALHAFSEQGYARITMEEVVKRYKAGESGPEIARAAGVTTKTIYSVLNRFEVPRRAAVHEMKHAARLRHMEKSQAKGVEKPRLALPDQPLKFGG